MFNPKKVKWEESELGLLERVVNIVDSVCDQMSADDEDPDKIDSDDLLVIMTSGFGDVIYIVRHFVSLGARAALSEAADLVSMLKRYYGLLDEKPAAPREALPSRARSKRKP